MCGTQCCWAVFLRFNDCFVEVEVLAEIQLLVVLSELAEVELLVVLSDELPDAFSEFGGDVDIVAVTAVKYLEAHDNFEHSADGQVLHSVVVDPVLGGGHACVKEASHHGSQGRRGTFACCRCS